MCGLWLVCGLVGVLGGFLLFVGEFVFLVVCLCACVFFLVVCLLFALFAACVVSSFWVCSSVSVFVFSCVVSCVLMDFRLPS